MWIHVHPRVSATVIFEVVQLAFVVILVTENSILTLGRVRVSDRSRGLKAYPAAAIRRTSLTSPRRRIMAVESPSNLPLPDAFLNFLNENGLDPSVYTNRDPTPRYVRYIHVFEKLKLLYQSQLVTSCCSIG